MLWVRESVDGTERGESQRETPQEKNVVRRPRGDFYVFNHNRDYKESPV